MSTTPCMCCLFRVLFIANEHVKLSVLSRYLPFLVLRSVGRFLTDGSRRHIGPILKGPDVKGFVD